MIKAHIAAGTEQHAVGRARPPLSAHSGFGPGLARATNRAAAAFGRLWPCTTTWRGLLTRHLQGRNIVIVARRERREYIVLGQLLTLGLTMGACVAIGVLLGLWVDKRFDISPIGTVVGFFIGLIAAFRELLRVTRLLEDGDASGHHPGEDE